jgi:chemotaxis response regulator CheB
VEPRSRPPRRLPEGLTAPHLTPRTLACASEHESAVLTVDDDPDFLATLRTVLDLDERLELVAEASDGARQSSSADELAPDVVAMDVLMPGMDGIEATRLIKRGSSSTSS